MSVLMHFGSSGFTISESRCVLTAWHHLWRVTSRLPRPSIERPSRRRLFLSFLFEPHIELHKTRGGDNISPTSNMRRIQWTQNYRETVPREEWDAMMELLLDDPTGLQTMQDEGWLFLAEHSLADTIRNEWNAAPTELQKEKWTGLQKLTDETYFGIITGQLPVDAFDEYVTTWKAQGGDEILAEINEWWANR